VDGKIVAMTKKSTSEMLKYEADIHSFFYGKVIVLYEFDPCCETVNKEL
jgi:hypothetical protein